MEALLPTLIAAFLAEWGDKTQLLVVALAARLKRPGPILTGVALAALANAALSAAGGWFIADQVNYRALSLLTALAFVFAGGGALFPARSPKVATDWKTGAFATALFAFVLVEFGDKTQFVTAAMSARTGSPVLAALGATLGVLAASVPAAMLGARLPRLVPVARIRLVVAILLLLVGFWMAAKALLLV
jgi:putative Ca2+/H+ antiporter (TMEM165/GDT1 family)